MSNEEPTIKNGKDLEKALEELLIPDSDKIRIAEKALGVFCENSQCILAFLQVIQRVNENSTGIRQMATLIMSKKIKTHWKSFSSENKNYIKKTLLESLVKEKS
jgi:hypothetical protein